MKMIGFRLDDQTLVPNSGKGFLFAEHCTYRLWVLPILPSYEYLG